MKHARTRPSVSSPCRSRSPWSWRRWRVPARRSDAGPDKIAFPEKYKDGVLYTIADRYDIKQYRELYVSPAAAVQAAKEGKPLPARHRPHHRPVQGPGGRPGEPREGLRAGAFQKGDLVGYGVMEKRQGWGTEYPDDLRNGEWEYSAFTADGEVQRQGQLQGVLSVPQAARRPGLRDLLSGPGGADRGRDGAAAGAAGIDGSGHR